MSKNISIQNQASNYVSEYIKCKNDFHYYSGVRPLRLLAGVGGVPIAVRRGVKASA